MVEHITSIEGEIGLLNKVVTRSSSKGKGGTSSKKMKVLEPHIIYGIVFQGYPSCRRRTSHYYQHVSHKVTLSSGGTLGWIMTLVWGN